MERESLPIASPLSLKKIKAFQKKKGQGLGLFHARKTLQDLGGKIKAESLLNKGTCISFFIPFK